MVLDTFFSKHIFKFYKFGFPLLYFQIELPSLMNKDKVLTLKCVKMSKHSKWTNKPGYYLN